MNLPTRRVDLHSPASPTRAWARWWRWLGLWLALLAPPVLAAEAGSVVRFDQAFYRPLGPAAPADWQAVALPDTWGARGLPLAGSAHYRLQLPLRQAPQGVWALRIDRLSNVHSIRVNGVLVQQRGDVLAAQGVPRVLATLVEFPAALLRVGDNQIDVQWRLAARAGMSVVIAGPSDLLLPGYDRARLRDQTLPQVMNVAGGALAAFLLLVWLQRRQEEAIGLFGVLWLLLSLRNYSYHVDATPLPSPWGDVLFFGAQCISVVLLGLFVIALSGDTLPRLRRLLRGLGLVLPALGALFGAIGQLQLLRQWMYPLLSLLSLLALGLLLRSLWRRPSPALAALVAGLAAVVAAGVHDYLFLHARLPITGTYWIPLVVPLGCVSFALVLIHRLVRALAVSEDLALKLEARVVERTLALQAADAAKTRFLAAASHDLRQPVAAIGLLVGLARERTPEPAQRTLLGQVQQAVQALETLLRGLLDLSRLDTPEAPPQRQPVALQVLFDGLALHHQADAQARGLRLRLRPSPLVVDTDPALLDQVLRNLVGNALRHTRQGGVLVAARRQGAQGVRLQVWDTGIGIPVDQQQRVFEPFVQLHNPARDRSQGQGLGLAIVRRAVDLLAHPLALRSVPGRGSCFSLDLPACPPAPPWAEALPPAVAAAPLAGRHLWLLDDDPVMRSALAARLTAWGASVQALASLAALQQALDRDDAPPDLLLTDLRLPDGDGPQAVTRLRGRHGPVPALALTGDTGAAAQADFASLGVVLLYKPVSPPDLLQRLLQGLGSS
jgi:signal transduction histidine kinase